jgi:hypothetical protein
MPAAGKPARASPAAPRHWAEDQHRDAGRAQGHPSWLDAKEKVRQQIASGLSFASNQVPTFWKHKSLPKRQNLCFQSQPESEAQLEAELETVWLSSKPV